jgi:hypothetical protein
MYQVAYGQGFSAVLPDGVQNLDVYTLITSVSVMNLQLEDFMRYCHLLSECFVVDFIPLQ